MKVDFGIHPNCSEWNQEVEADDTDYFIWREEEAERLKKKALEALKGWDQ